MILPLTTSERMARRPWATIALIGLCVAVFFTLRAEQNRLAFVSPSQPVKLVLYAFAHADFMHLAGNVYFLWTFGRVLENRWSALFLVPAFAIASAAGALLHYAAHPGSEVGLVGASGAIAGLAGALIVALPNARFNRLFSPLFWPVTPIVALARRRGAKALLELLPFYGWVLKLERGIPAYFVLPAWLSLDLFSMMLTPKEHVSYACHVGGAFAGIGIAIVLRATRAPDLMVSQPDDGVAWEDRPSRWPEGSLNGALFVLSLLVAVGLTAGTALLGARAQDFVTKKQTASYRTKILGATDPNAVATETSFEHTLFTLVYPAIFTRCEERADEKGKCAKSPPPTPGIAFLEVVHPDVPESIVVLAVQHGANKRSELADSIVKSIAKEDQTWRMLDTHSGTCFGEWNIESTFEIGDGDLRQRMWACTFTKGLDLYLAAYTVPELLRERDEPLLHRVLERIAFPQPAPPPPPREIAVLTPTPSSAKLPPPPPPGGKIDPSDNEPTQCAPGEISYRVEGKLRCQAVAGAAPTPPRRNLPPPRRR